MSTHAPAGTSRAERYAALVPVKPPVHGKSRLVGTTDEQRRDLAAAFATDTVAACLATPRVAEVLVVSDDAWFSTRLSGLGCAAIPDGVAGDLNATLLQAVAEAHRRWPDLRPLAVCADLPALRPDHLDAALAAPPTDGPWFVADAAGTGTTLYSAAHADFAPRFGAGSRFAHLGTGALEAEHAPASLRRDVDDLEDLREALALGLGAATSTALADLGGVLDGAGAPDA